MSCDKCKNKKKPTNNQWAGTAAFSALADDTDKTEFSNEWISTNKMVDEEDVEKEINKNQKKL